MVKSAPTYVPWIAWIPVIESLALAPPVTEDVLDRRVTMTVQIIVKKVTVTSTAGNACKVCNEIKLEWWPLLSYFDSLSWFHEYD